MKKFKWNIIWGIIGAICFFAVSSLLEFIEFERQKPNLPGLKTLSTITIFSLTLLFPLLKNKEETYLKSLINGTITSFVLTFSILIGLVITDYLTVNRDIKFVSGSIFVFILATILNLVISLFTRKKNKIKDNSILDT